MKNSFQIFIDRSFKIDKYGSIGDGLSLNECIV